MCRFHGRTASKGKMAAGSTYDPEAAAAAQDPEPLTDRSTTDPRCARITWASLHAFGFLMLWLSGNGPSWPDDRPFLILTMLTALLYAAASLVDPGHITGEESICQSASSNLAIAANPLLDLPQCNHCQARQVARTKVCSQPS